MARGNWIGETLGGRYTIEQLLGQGGMSAVYRATDPNLKRVVAIKLIHTHLSGDPSFVRRFEEEAATVAQLRHPNIIQVYDFNHDEDTYYIVFEFVPGETLHQRLKRLNDGSRKMAPAEAVRLAAGVADALAYAHNRNLIHRDVKPANVMINVQGEPILMDFGIVKIVGGTTHTATGATIGTARYMSPEQIRSENIDHRSDIYSLGATVFEMLAGRAPFEAESAMTMMMMHITDPVPDLRELRPEISPALAQVIAKSLAKNPDERYQSASDFAAALRSADLTAAAAGAVPLAAAQTVVEPLPSESSPKKAAATAGAAMSAAAAAGVAASTGGRSQPADTPPPAGTGTPAKRPPWLLIGGAAVALIVLFGCIIGVAALAPSILRGDDEVDIAATEAASDEALAVLAATDEQTGRDVEHTRRPTATPTRAGRDASAAVATATREPQPTDTPEPVYTATSPPPTHTAAPTAAPVVYTPTPTVAAPTATPEPYVRIDSITVNGGGQYVVAYLPIGYTPQLPGTHIHFFFDTVPPEQAGVPGNGPWILYGGPNPFTQYSVSDRPAGANAMCALVANPDHSVIAGTGNCYPLP